VRSVTPAADAAKPLAPGAWLRAGPAWPILLLGIGTALLYGLLFNRDFSVDGLQYAYEVEAGAPLFHPNHLLFNALHAGLWHGASWLGIAPLRAIDAMQAVTATLGVLTVVCLAHYLAPRAGARRAALLGALLACSFGFWNFAQEPEAYVPPLFCIALSLVLLRDPARAPGWPRTAVLAVLAVFAVLLLQQHVFWYPVLLLLLAARLRGDATRRVKLWLVGLGVPAVCLLVYLGTGLAADRLGDPSALFAWLLGYGYEPGVGLETYRAAPPFGARLAGLVLGLGNLLFAYEVAMHGVWIAVAGTGAILVFATLAPAWTLALRARSTDAFALLLFFVANLGFAFWWESRNIEFLLPLAFAAIALAGLGSAALRIGWLATCVLAVLVINAATAFVPQRETPTRYLRAQALHQVERLASGDLLIAEELNTARWLRYFEEVDVGFLPGAVSAAMHGEQALVAARAQLLAALAGSQRVYTMERNEHGRLRALARRAAILGRVGYRGEVESDVDALYDGLVLVPVAGAPGVERVMPPTDPGGSTPR
jgi:hypothetical protein